MPAQQSILNSPPSLSPAALDLLDRFDSLWLHGERPDLDAILASCPNHERLPVQVEMIHADLEFRIKAGEDARTEEYLKRYPALAALSEIVSGLITAEFRLRSRRGTVDLAGFAMRFPNHAALIEQLELEQASRMTLRHISLQDTVPPVQSTSAASSGPPRVPGYEILSELGRGGMGVVYKARQTRLKRLVALKMILAGSHAGDAARGRFQTEAQAIAALQHPNIVQVHEVGEHEGKPFFSLEFCGGGSLERKLRGTPLPPREAAQLVETLARAVHAAHTHQIVHRDLKPANVLLAEDGAPKITDFGLAKKLDEAGQTQSGAIMGTPSYMAPEQAGGKTSDIGPAADVYALGAILYECLTGRPPFKAANVMETLRQVLSDEPVSPRQLQSQTSRDLETICLKCLHKEAGKRYASAAALADDLRRYLNGEPIMARPVSRVERAAKWARRRPMITALLFLSAGLLALSALVALIGGGAFLVQYYYTLQESIRAQNAEKQARLDKNEALLAKQAALDEAQRRKEEAQHRKEEADRAEQVTGVLIGLFQGGDPIGLQSSGFRPNKKGQVTAKDLLDTGAQKLADELKQQPQIRARLLNLLGGAYRTLGEWDAARKLLKEGLEIRLHLEGEHDLEIAESYHSLGWLEHDFGDYPLAEMLYRKALALREQHPDAELEKAETCLALAWLLGDQRNPECERFIREALEIRTRRLDSGHHDVAVANIALAALMLALGRPLEAVGPMEKARAGFARLKNGEHIEQGITEFQSGVIAMHFGQYQLADQRLTNSLKITREFLGPGHHYAAMVQGQRAQNAEAWGKLDQAEADLRECLDVTRQSVGMAHPWALVAMDAYAGLLERRHRTAEVLPLYEEALRACDARYGPRHPNRVTLLLSYADLLCKLNRIAQAEKAAKEAVALLTDSNAPKRHDIIWWRLKAVGIALFKANRDETAVSLWTAALESAEHFEGRSDELAWLHIRLAISFQRRDKLDDAAQHFQKAVSIVQADRKASPGQRAVALTSSVGVEQQRKRWAEVEKRLREALALWKEEPAYQRKDQDFCVSFLAEALVQQGKSADALRVLDDSLELLDGSTDATLTHRVVRLSQRAIVALTSGDAANYRESCHRLLPLLDRASPRDRVTILEVLAFGVAAPEDRAKARDSAMRRELSQTLPGLIAPEPQLCSILASICQLSKQDSESASVLGALLYREGKDSEALACLTRAQALRALGSWRYLDRCVLAVLEARRGNTALAHSYADDVERSVRSRSDLRWDYRLLWLQLVAEARQMIPPR
jgi:tRNA A-37 threonylcarbamoyl transferase component Bud32